MSYDTIKLLIITYPFPPIPYSGTYRTVRMCKGLIKLGMEVHVLSINADDRIPNNYELLAKLPKSLKVHRTYIFDPWLRYRKWRKKRDKLELHSYVDRIAALFMKIITLPDHQIFWIPFATLRSMKIIKQYGIQNVLISAPPNSSLFIGYFLKLFKKVKFIADLRDPIVGNIAQVNLINPVDILSKIEKKSLICIERIIITNADVVITNTETHRQEMKEKYRQDKFYTVRNSFDKDDYKGIRIDKYGKFTISHIGSMYGLRKADLFLQAIKLLETKVSPMPLNLEVLFVGQSDGSIEKAISKYGVEKYVAIQPPVAHRKAIEIMTRSHLLLLVKEMGEGGSSQIPAKFYEYLGTGNPILCIGTKESEVANLIRESQAGYVEENDFEKLAEVLEKLLSTLPKYSIYSSNKSHFNEFDNIRMAKQILNLVSSLE